MGIYVPGTTETDPKKQNRSLQQLGAATEKTKSDVATAQSDITTAQSDISSLQTTVAGLPTTAVTSVATSGLATGGTITSTGTINVPAAAKSDQVTATSTAKAVVPGVQQNHPSALKAWVAFSGSSGTILASYNVTSVTRNSTGSYTVNFTTAFSSSSYACVVTATTTAGSNIFCELGTLTASTAPIFTIIGTGGLIDPTMVCVMCAGTQ